MQGEFCSLSRVLQAKKRTPETSFGKGAIAARGLTRFFKFHVSHIVTFHGTLNEG